MSIDMAIYCYMYIYILCVGYSSILFVRLIDVIPTKCKIVISSTNQLDLNYWIIFNQKTMSANYFQP